MHPSHDAPAAVAVGAPRKLTLVRSESTREIHPNDTLPPRHPDADLYRALASTDDLERFLLAEMLGDVYRGRA